MSHGYTTYPVINSISTCRQSSSN